MGTVSHRWYVIALCELLHPVAFSYTPPHDIILLWYMQPFSACIMSIYVLNIESGGKIRDFEYEELARAERFISSLEKGRKASSPYTKVQTLSFQIYTGGAPAFITDEAGKERRNPECKGCK